MIQNFQKASQSLAFKIFLGILAGSFVIMWGVGDMWQRVLSPHNATVATVGKVKIKMDDFLKALDQEMRIVQVMQGKKISPEEFAKAGFERVVLQNLLRNALIDQECDRLKMRIGDDVVAKTIRNDSSLKNKDGAFNRDRFNRYLQVLGMSEKQYIEQVRKDLRRQQLVSISASSLVLSKPALDLIYERTHQVLHLRLLRVPFVPVSTNKDLKYKVTEPSEDVLKKFFEENGNAFRVPEARSVTIMKIASEHFPAKVSDGDVRKTFDARFGSQKKIKFENVKKEIYVALLREKNAHHVEELRRILDDKIAEGGTLESIAENLKKPELKTLKVDEINQVGQIKNQQDDAAKFLLHHLKFDQADFIEIMKTIFTTEDGHVSQMVELPSGNFVFVQVRGVKPSYLPDFKSVSQSVRNVYIENEQLRITQMLAQDMAKSYEMTDRKKPLKLLEADKGHTLKTVSNQRYQLMRTLKEEGLEGFEQYLDTMNKGEIMILPDLKLKSMIIMQVASIVPHKGEPSEETQQKIIQGITQEMRRDAVESYLQQLMKTYRVDINKKALEKSPLLPH